VASKGGEIMFAQLGTVFVLGLGFALGYVFCINEYNRSETKEKLIKLHNELRKDSDGK